MTQARCRRDKIPEQTRVQIGMTVPLYCVTSPSTREAHKSIARRSIAKTPEATQLLQCHAWSSWYSCMLKGMSLAKVEKQLSVFWAGTLDGIPLFAKSRHWGFDRYSDHCYNCEVHEVYTYVGNYAWPVRFGSPLWVVLESLSVARFWPIKWLDILRSR